jgi:adiponectin receptor
VFVYSLHPNFGKPEYRSIRGFLFLTLGLSAGLPFLHLIFFNHHVPGHIENPTLLNWFIGGMCYVFGVLLYVKRFPECKWPGKFCIIVLLF